MLGGKNLRFHDTKQGRQFCLCRHLEFARREGLKGAVIVRALAGSDIEPDGIPGGACGG
jgi:hypothetical protein